MWVSMCVRDVCTDVAIMLHITSETFPIIWCVQTRSSVDGQQRQGKVLDFIKSWTKSNVCFMCICIAHVIREYVTMYFSYQNVSHNLMIYLSSKNQQSQIQLSRKFNNPTDGAYNNFGGRLMVRNSMDLLIAMTSFVILYVCQLELVWMRKPLGKHQKPQENAEPLQSTPTGMHYEKSIRIE